MQLNAERVCEQITGWLKEKVTAAGASGTVVGLSGGLDSAVAAALCKRAFPDSTLGVIMPIQSDPLDAALARELAVSLNLDVREIDLGPIWEALLNILEKAVPVTDDDDPALRLARANVKPRLRMISLYYFAARMNALVIGTDNLSELTIGYFTKYGDGGVDLMPLANLTKGEVRELAVYLGVPSSIIARKPTAGLWHGQTDEEEMGFSYDVIDHYLLTGEGPAEVADYIETMRRRSAHKRETPPKGPVPERASRKSAAIGPSFSSS